MDAKEEPRIGPAIDRSTIDRARNGDRDAFELMYPDGEPCDDERPIGPLLLKFIHPVDIDKVNTGEPCCG